MKRNLIVSFCFLAFNGITGEHKRLSQQDYVQQWHKVAIKQMHEHNIPASITLAQGILESGNGNSDLAVQANNHFGIKCHDWKGETFYKDDDTKNECFRSYKNAEESYKDHGLFLTTRSRYASLFKFDPTDYKNWAHGLKEAGYATNPKYPNLLIDLIERLDLKQYDKSGTSKNKQTDLLVNKDSKPSAVKISSSRTVLKHANQVKYIVAKKGDTYYRIAKEFDMGVWQLYRYNDYGPKKDVLDEGDIVYIQPKKRKSKSKASHVVSTPMTLRQISQIEGIKLSALLDKNTIASPDAVLQKGEKVNLR